MIQPFEQAVADYLSGKKDAEFTLERSDGKFFVIPIAKYFETVELTRIEREALSLCNGKVLDAGAGTGRHSLILSEKGLEVTSIDIVSANVSYMIKSGVKDARLVNLFDLSGIRFNSILLLNRGLGICSYLEKFVPMLHHLSYLLEPGGVVIGDSTVVSSEIATTPNNSGVYGGDVQLRVKYKDILGRPFNWLYIDEVTIQRYAQSAGWDCDIICHEQNDFLAVLKPQKILGV